MHHRRVLRARLPLPALDECDHVAIGILDHSNGGLGPDGRFGPRAGDVRGFQPLDHLGQIDDDKGQTDLLSAPLMIPLACCHINRGVFAQHPNYAVHRIVADMQSPGICGASNRGPQESKARAQMCSTHS